MLHHVNMKRQDNISRLNNLVLKWHPKSRLFIQFLNGVWNQDKKYGLIPVFENQKFNNQTLFYHMNARLFRYFDPNCIYVTSFSSISYWSNSKYWPQKHIQSGNIHYFTLFCQSVFFFGKQDWVKTEYQTEARSLSTS